MNTDSLSPLRGKKITILIHEYYPVLCGGSVFAEKMAIELGLLGYEIEILTPKIGSGRDDLAANSSFTIKHVYTGRSSKTDATLLEHLQFAILGFPQLLYHLWRRRPALVFSIFVIPSGLLGLMTCRILGIPHLVFVDAGDTPGIDSAMTSIVRYLTPVFSWVTGRSDAVVVLEGIEDLACPHIRNSNLWIIPNGASVSAKIAAPGTHGKKVQFLSVGRLVLRKGFDHVIEAFAKVRVNSADFHLTIVGYGAKQSELSLLIEKCNLQDHVSLVGRVEYERLETYYLASDCYLFYGDREGSSLAMIDAVAYGLPVIASDHPGNRSFIRHAESGLLVAHRDTAALAEAILAVIQDRGKLIRYGQNARALGEQYSWPRIAKRYDSVIADVIHKA